VCAFGKNATQVWNFQVVHISIGDGVRTHTVDGDHQDRLMSLGERRCCGKNEKTNCNFEPGDGAAEHGSIRVVVRECELKKNSPQGAGC
jgi:hypothetical protein